MSKQNSNQFGGERKLEGDGYTRAVQAIDVLAAAPKAAAQLVVEATETSLDRSLEGGWPARLILAHLRDVESLHYRLTLERLLRGEEPQVAEFDNEGWEAGRNPGRDRKELLLADFALQRQASLGLLRALRPRDWERPWRSAEDPGHQLTTRDLVERWIAHDRAHLAQLQTALGTTLEQELKRRSVAQ